MRGGGGVGEVLVMEPGRVVDGSWLVPSTAKWLCSWQSEGEPPPPAGLNPQGC